MFLEYLKEKNKHMNLNQIQKIKFNKKSITVSIYKDSYNFFFNDIFSKQSLLNMVLNHYSNYKNIDLDYLRYKYQTINIRLVN